MNAKRMGSGWLVVVVLLLAGAVGLAIAGEEPPKKDRKVSVYSGERMMMFGSSWLGVQISDVTPERAKELKLAGEYGVVVVEVVEESPAAQAGLQANDVIVSFADERVRSAEQLRRLVRETPAGRSVSVQVSRDGQTRTLQVTPEAHEAEMFMPRMRGMQPPMPPEAPVAPMPPHAFWVETPELDVQVYSRGPQLGISGDELTPQLAEYFGVKAGKGVLVREVLTGTAAEKAGLKAGDVIVKVDGDAVGTLGELRRALRKKREGKQASLTIVRNRAEQTISVELDQPQSRAPQRVTQGLDVKILPKEELDRLTAELAARSAEWKRELEEGLAQQRVEWQDAAREAQENLRDAKNQIEQLRQDHPKVDWDKFEKELRELGIEIKSIPMRVVI